MTGSSSDLLITRPLPRGRAYAEAVEARWPGRFTPLFQPLTRIRPEPGAIVTDGVQALLFTSAAGVQEYARRSPERGLPALCVGEATARAARDAGLAAEAAGGDVVALAQLAAGAWQPGAGDYLHVRGRQVSGDLCGALGAEGIGCREVVVYDAVPVPALDPATRIALAEGRPAVASFFSARAAAIFADFATEARFRLDGTTALAISEQAAHPLLGAGFAGIVIAPSPDLRGMVDGLGQFGRA